MSNNWFSNQEVAEKVKKELLELIPAKQIAKNVGCNYQTIVNYAKKIGIWEKVKQRNTKGGITLITEDLAKHIKKGDDGRFYKNCPRCGVMQSYLRATYAIESFKQNKLCKSCSNKETDNSHRGIYREIRISWFNKFKLSAANRKYSWNITIDDIADIFHAQNRECALTGWDISCPEETEINKIPMSIDRKDNSVGYEKDNVHLIHRKINMMRGKYDLKEYIEACKAVAKHM